MAPFIEAENLRKTYRLGKIEVPALRGIVFTVQRGEFVSIVGPSGSGKSTLFYLLGGLTRADSGRIVIDGDDFSKLSDAERTTMRKRKIGFVFQKFNLLPTLDANSNILIAQDIAGKNGQNDPAYFQKITDLLGLPSACTTVRRNFREASNCASLSPALLLISRLSCWPTSPPGISIPRILKSCYPCCGNPIANWARRL